MLHRRVSSESIVIYLKGFQGHRQNRKNNGSIRKIKQSKQSLIITEPQNLNTFQHRNFKYADK